jgi:peptidoglycan/xylan/chitin deacetylase (PgdA/CDA1 family)
VPWFDRLAMAFKMTKAGRFATSRGEAACISGTQERLAALERTLISLKQLPDRDRRHRLEQLLTMLGVPGENGFASVMLTWDEVRALARVGFSIGGHTVTHPILSRIDADGARTEIVTSQAMIAAACGQPPRAFAYPNGGPGDYTEAAKDLVREAGYTCAVTTRFGVNTPATCVYELGRGGP